MVNPTPQQPSGTTSGIKDVLTADPDVVLYNTTMLDAEVIADLVLQEIGGLELAIIENGDGVVGRFVDNRLIANLTDINSEFQPSFLGGANSGELESIYGYTLSKYIPLDTDGNQTAPVSVSGGWIHVELLDPPAASFIEVTVETSDKEYVLNIADIP